MKSKAEKFWDSQAKSYDREEAKESKKYEHIVEQTKQYLQPHYLVLDVGCGTGRFSNELAHKVKQIEAIDFSKKMIEVAKANTLGKGISNVTYTQATITDTRLEPKKYDVIVCFYLLHLLDNPEEAMRRAKELLKPGGVLISVTPCMGENPVLGFLFSILGRLNLLPKISLFKQPDLVALITEAGYVITEMELIPGTANQYFIVAK